MESMFMDICIVFSPVKFLVGHIYSKNTHAFTFKAISRK